MSTRSNPLEELERFFERMSHQFDDTRMWDPSGSIERWSSEFGTMAVDLIDRDDEFVATVDMPGFDREEIDVRVTDHTLRITAEHEERLDEEKEEGRYIRHERRRESADRSIRLPDDVDPDEVTARMKNGVLTITLPKLEAEEARGIEIEDAS
ncbi:MAG: Hsp20/alpha crystallin family protein [Natronomonas sp.]|jgi:HSP20 family protein|uniref:Hsp20/alpha crystallin family protein n=1 Tax=Natronomonas sp. TaxID=2184060 RepID=UPI002870749C|nr:Hsp20/alpha crystallin family protein [Natronomonas sp.]MDR9430843.1 Hsp20/alpha crystallin family protein [Natronomonas sp.]